MTTNPQQPEPWWTADDRLKPHALPAATVPDQPSMTGGFDGSIEIPDLPAVSVPASAPTDQNPLREPIRLAVARQFLDEAGSGRHVEELDDDEFGAFADAVLAVLPAPADRPACDCEAEVHMGVGFYHQPQCATRNSQPADRAAIEAAAYRAAANYVRGNSADERYGKASISTAMCTVADELYRWAAAAASGSGRVADETQAEAESRCEKCPPADGADTVDWAEIDRRTAQSGIDTPGCDCGHDGMGASWHSKDCEWGSVPPCDHCGVRGHSFEDCPRDEQPAVVSQPDEEPWFGMPGCTCKPWTVEDGQPRYLEPHETVDKVSGWARRADCPHHQPAEDPS